MSLNQPHLHTVMVVTLTLLIPVIIPQLPIRQSLMMISVVLLPSIQQLSQSMKSNAYAENWPKLHYEIFHRTLASQANQLQSAAIKCEPTNRNPYILPNQKLPWITSKSSFRALEDTTGLLSNSLRKQQTNQIAFWCASVFSLADAFSQSKVQ